VKRIPLGPPFSKGEDKKLLVLPFEKGELEGIHFKGVVKNG